jgi:hypothetical protein
MTDNKLNGTAKWIGLLLALALTFGGYAMRVERQVTKNSTQIHAFEKQLDRIETKLDRVLSGVK